MMPGMSTWAQLGLALAGIVCGAAVTWYFSWRYYVRAGRDQRQENDSLRKAVSLVLKALEEAGVEFTYGPDGSIRGVVRNASSSIAAKSNLSASAVVEQFLDRATLQIDLTSTGRRKARPACHSATCSAYLRQHGPGGRVAHLVLDLRSRHATNPLGERVCHGLRP